MEPDTERSPVVETESVNNSDEATDTEKSKKPKYQSTYKIRLELAVLLIYFAVNLSGPIYQNQIMYQTCTVVFGNDAQTCHDIGTSKVNTEPQLKEIENMVQPYASKIFMAGSLIQAIVPAILALFIGAWSDKFGRKPVMLFTSAGYIGYYVVIMIVAAISLKQNVNPWIYLVGSIPISLTGGNCALLSAIYCYVADLTSFYERPYKMCFMSGVVALGNLLGQLVSSYLYEASNASVVFAISAVAQIIAIIYIVFVIGESVKSEQLSSESKFRGFFDWQLIAVMLKTVFKKRPHFQRAIIWCIVLPLTALVFDSAGSGNVFFLFVRAKFGWSVQNYTVFNSIQIVIAFVGAVAGILVLQLVLGCKQSTMTLIAYGCYVVLSAFFAAANASWCLYVGIGITFLLGIANPMGQAMLVCTVAACDIGKVFALLTALEAIAPLIASPLYTFVYNATLETYPNAYNCISLGLHILCFIATLFVHIAEFRHPHVNRIRK